MLGHVAVAQLLRYKGLRFHQGTTQCLLLRMWDPGHIQSITLRLLLRAGYRGPHQHQHQKHQTLWVCGVIMARRKLFLQRRGGLLLRLQLRLQQ